MSQAERKSSELKTTKPKSLRRIAINNSYQQEGYETCWKAQDKLRTQLLDLRHRLMLARTDSSNRLKWDTPAAVRKSLRWCLYIRGLFISTGKLVSEMHDRMSVLTARFYTFTVKSKSDELKRPERRDPRIVRSVANALACNLQTPEQYFSLKELHDDYNALLAECDLLWNNADLILSSLPTYKSIKHLLPINGRAAYSMLMVLGLGRADTTMPQYNIFLGWAHDHNTDNMITNIKSMCRAMRRGIEHHGKPPSLADGRRLLKTLHFSLHDQTKPWEYKQPAIGNRMATLARKHDRLIAARTFCGDFNSSNVSPSFCKLLARSTSEQQADQYKWHRIAHKVMGLRDPVEPQVLMDSGHAGNVVSTDQRISNQTLTILTGPVQHLHGDDYYAPAAWTAARYVSNRSYSRSAETRPATVQGYVLMRKGWPDVVHVTSLEPSHESGSNLTASDKLDAASQSHFRRLRDEVESKLTQNQRIARLLKRVRKLFVNFTRQASYASGNCVPGTEAFIASLNLKTVTPDVLENKMAEVEPRALAQCWRKAKYIQTERFLNVVVQLEGKQQNQIARACQIAQHFFPLETDAVGFGPLSDWSDEVYAQYQNSQGWLQAGTQQPGSLVPDEQPVVQDASSNGDALYIGAVSQLSVGSSVMAD